MKKFFRIALGFCFAIYSFLGFQNDAEAISVAEQTTDYSSNLSVWQVIQELGDNLSGTAEKFTFRVRTNQPNLTQFDHPGENSRLYDKTNNTYIYSCIPAGSNPTNRLRGLTFNASGVPAGYEDVTLDFSCRNYTFDSTHKYLIYITNANAPNSLSNLIQFGASSFISSGSDFFTKGGLRYGNGNIWDYANNSGSCNPTVYTWNSTNPWHNGCYVWTSPKDDLYFTLTNTSPPPKTPVVFIPGIGGSELKASQDIYWSSDDGHGGTYSHAYPKDEKIWVNQDEAIKLGDDDYFDVLRLKPDGQTAEAPGINLTGNLSPFGYGDIDPFFTNMGYEKGKNFFVFAYDWRKDIQTTKADLDTLIETAKQKSGQNKVNIVAHSMGGLVARYYISDSSKASKVNKLIELGVPHLGSVDSLKTLRYGSWLGYDFGLFTIGIPPSETNDNAQNLPSIFELIPSSKYYVFYDNVDETTPYPYRDDRDIDSNNETGALDFNQTKTLLSNLDHNMAIFNIAEQFHNILDPTNNQNNGVKIYEIVGSSQPTLGQIIESWWIAWPIKLISKTDEIYINGDEIVPLYSASLKNTTLDISGATKIYYVEQKHNDLVSKTGIGMKTVRSILDEDNSLPSEAQVQKIVLEGQQVSVDQDASLDIYDSNGNHTGLNSNGDVEANIPNTFYDSLGTTKHIFVKKTAGKVTAKIKSTKNTKTKIKIRNYAQDSINKTIFYNNVPVDTQTTQFTIDPTVTSAPVINTRTQTILASTEATGSAALDQTLPVTNIQIDGTKNDSGAYVGDPTVTLTANDAAGISTIEYSLDNGQTIQTYTNPFTISTPGNTIIQVKSTDNVGNEEIPQSQTIEIADSNNISTTASASASTSSNNNTSSSNSSPNNSPTTSTVDSSSTSTTTDSNIISTSVETSNSVPKASGNVLGSNFKFTYSNEEIKTLHPEKQISKNSVNKPIKEPLSDFLMIPGEIITLASTGLFASFRKQSPNKI